MRDGKVLEDPGDGDQRESVQLQVLDGREVGDAGRGGEGVVGDFGNLGEDERLEAGERGERVAKAGDVDADALQGETLEPGPDVAVAHLPEVPLRALLRALDESHESQVGAVGGDLAPEHLEAGVAPVESRRQVRVHDVGARGDCARDVHVDGLADRVRQLEVADQAGQRGVGAEGLREEVDALVGGVCDGVIDVVVVGVLVAGAADQALCLFGPLCAEFGLEGAVVQGVDADGGVSGSSGWVID